MEIKPKKSLGQNFLIDKNIIQEIVNRGNINNKDVVLEVGPGTGNLTEYILKKKPKKIFVIEKDKNLTDLLNKKFNNSINILNKDVLQFNLNNISDQKLIIFGNLPYNISTQILINWITNNENCYTYKKLILMFQKEVADRILAKTNSKNYGRLSIISNWKLEIKKEFNIGPNCFVPKPKIESTLLSFVPKKNFFQLSSPTSLEKITRIFFNQRRKMIKNPLKQIFKKNNNIEKNFKLDLNLRPQNLDPLTYFKLTKEWEKLNN